MARKKMGDNSYGWIIPTAVVVAVGFGIYYVLKNGIPGLGPSADNKGNNDSVDANQKSISAGLNTSGATLSDADLNSIVTSIYTAGGNNDGDQIVSQLQKLGNQADYNRAYQLFGTKQASASWFSTCNLLGFNCQSFDLGAWISNILTTAQKQNINAFFSTQGITAQF